MPRPKPPEPLNPRQIRMSDSQWEAFQAWGGADRLRLLLGAQPAGYFAVFQKPEYNKADATFIKRKRERND